MFYPKRPEILTLFCVPHLTPTLQVEPWNQFLFCLEDILFHSEEWELLLLLPPPTFGTGALELNTWFWKSIKLNRGQGGKEKSLTQHGVNESWCHGGIAGQMPPQELYKCPALSPPCGRRTLLLLLPLCFWEIDLFWLWSSATESVAMGQRERDVVSLNHLLS